MEKTGNTYYRQNTDAPATLLVEGMEDVFQTFYIRSKKVLLFKGKNK